MADFLGEKEEITSLETLSYGANTMRDGANISQGQCPRYAKENVVSGAQIMDLTTGSAFVRFYGIPIVEKIQFKLHRTTPSSKANFTLDENSKTINISEKSEKEISQILEFLRYKRKHTIVFDKDGNLTTKFAKNIDIILNPIDGNYSWNIIEEFKEDKIALVELLISQNELDGTEKEYLFEHLYSKNSKNTKSIFQIIRENTNLRDKLDYLFLLENNLRKITISQYVSSTPTFVVFVNSTQNENHYKIAQMISTVCSQNDIFMVLDNKEHV